MLNNKYVNFPLRTIIFIVTILYNDKFQKKLLLKCLISGFYSFRKYFQAPPKCHAFYNGEQMVNKRNFYSHCACFITLFQ